MIKTLRCCAISMVLRSMIFLFINQNVTPATSICEFSYAQKGDKLMHDNNLYLVCSLCAQKRPFGAFWSKSFRPFVWLLSVMNLNKNIFLKKPRCRCSSRGIFASHAKLYGNSCIQPLLQLFGISHLSHNQMGMTTFCRGRASAAATCHINGLLVMLIWQHGYAIQKGRLNTCKELQKTMLVDMFTHVEVHEL